MGRQNDLFLLLAAAKNDASWFTKPMNRAYKIKALEKWTEDELQTFGGKLTSKTDRALFQNLIEDYMRITIDFVSRQLKTNELFRKDLACTAFPTSRTRGAQTSSRAGDGAAGEVLWAQYPAGAGGDPEYKTLYDALPTDADRKTCDYYQALTGHLLLYNSIKILSDDLQTTIRLELQANEEMTWADWKEIISAEMPDTSAKDILESLFILLRGLEQTIQTWTEGFAVLKKMLEEKNTLLPTVIYYHLWYSQILPEEEAAGEFDLPKTTAAKNKFDFAKHARGIKKKGMQYASFDPARVKKYTRTLLIEQPLDSISRPRPPKKQPKKQQQQPADKPHPPATKTPEADPDGYDCECCNIFHKVGQHTPAGRLVLNGRNARKDKTNLVCHGCKKKGHFVAECPDKKEVKIETLPPTEEEHHLIETFPTETELGVPNLPLADQPIEFQLMVMDSLYEKRREDLLRRVNGNDGDGTLETAMTKLESDLELKPTKWPT